MFTDHFLNRHAEGYHRPLIKALHFAAIHLAFDGMRPSTWVSGEDVIAHARLLAPGIVNPYDRVFMLRYADEIADDVCCIAKDLARGNARV